MRISKGLLLRGGILIVILAIVGTFIWFFTNPNYKYYADQNMRPTWDIADNIKVGSQNTSFATQINQVDYYTFLHGEGPFTVFVPTNKAYSNLPANDQDLLNSDPGSLRQIILYNIVKGRYTLSDLHDGMTLHTIQGDDISVARNGNTVILDGYAYIDTGDVFSKNGVIHMTTNYLIPPSMVH